MEYIIEEEYGIFKPVVKGLRKAVALAEPANVRARMKEENERKVKNKRVSDPRKARIAKLKSLRKAYALKAEQEMLEEENRIRMEVLMEEHENYEERKMQREINEMFEEYNKNSNGAQYEVVLDVTPIFDEKNA